MVVVAALASPGKEDKGVLGLAGQLVWINWQVPGQWKTLSKQWEQKSTRWVASEFSSGFTCTLTCISDT